MQRSERRHLVLLDVAGGPVVVQDISEYVVGGAFGVHASAKLDGLGYESAQLDFEIQLSRWLAHGPRLPGVEVEATWTDQVGAGQAY